MEVRHQSPATSGPEEPRKQRQDQRDQGGSKKTLVSKRETLGEKSSIDQTESPGMKTTIQGSGSATTRPRQGRMVTLVVVGLLNSRIAEVKTKIADLALDLVTRISLLKGEEVTGEVGVVEAGHGKMTTLGLI